MAVLVVAAALGYWLILRYLRSDDFRKLLSSRASSVLAMQGEFQPFLWDGFAVRSGGFQARSDGPLRQLNLTSLSTEIGLGGIRRGVWQASGTRLKSLTLDVDASQPLLTDFAARQTTTMAQSAASASHSTSSWLPQQVELDGVVIESLSARVQSGQGLTHAQNIRVEAFPTATRNDHWDLSLQGGSITPPMDWLPRLYLQSATLRCNRTAIYLSQANAKVWQQGLLTCSGEFHPALGELSLEGDLQDVKCSEWLNETWAQRLSGDTSIQFQARMANSGPEAAGTLEIRNAVLTALPILDTLAAYADTRRFRTLMLNDARCRWRWKQKELHLSQLELGSEGLARLEGQVSIVNRNLSGTLRLGLLPGTLSHLPGAETQVFQSGERNLLWTTVTLSGTVDDPREDLSERLLLAAGARMLETLPDTGRKVLKFTGKLAEQAAPAAVETGREVIESGREILRNGAAAPGIVSDILDGVLQPVLPTQSEPTPDPSSPQQ